MSIERPKIFKSTRNPGVTMTAEEIQKSIDKYNLELMDLDNQIYSLKARQDKIKLLQNALITLLDLHASSS